MAYQRVPETAQINTVFSVDDAGFEMTFHAQKAGGYNQADLDALAAAIDFTAIPGLKAILSSNVQYLRTDVRGLDSEFDLVSTADLSAGFGGVGVNLLPINVAFCVRKLSGLTGRSARGRTYISGIPNTYVETGAGNQNLISTAAANAYVAWVDSVRLTIENIGAWNAVIVSRSHDGGKRAEAVTFAWVTSSYKDRRFDTQRKRIRSS